MRKLLHPRRALSAAFTLVELIVVIGLMALLSTISTAGYFAVTRGMAARGVIQDTASLIRVAMQSCLVDQVPTAVLFCNYRDDQEAKGGDCYGKAIAVRMAGRVSYLASASVNGGGNLLVDEFADWDTSYSTRPSTGNAQLGIRFYNMSRDKLKGGILRCSSLMCSYVMQTSFSTDYMISTGKKVEEWCSSANKDGNRYRWGLPFHPKNDGISMSEWKIGDAYGTEIGQLTLPRNYIFGTSVPKKIKLEPANPSALVFTPDMVTGSGNYKFSLGSAGGTVTITMLNDAEGRNTEKVGEITDDLLKDQD